MEVLKIATITTTELNTKLMPARFPLKKLWHYEQHILGKLTNLFSFEE